MESLTLRDPAGQVFRSGGKLYRAVSQKFEIQAREFFDSDFFGTNVKDRTFPRTHWLESSEKKRLLDQMQPHLTMPASSRIYAGAGIILSLIANSLKKKLKYNLK